jgi:HrpA-like RNA helicase
LVGETGSGKMMQVSYIIFEVFLYVICLFLATSLTQLSCSFLPDPTIPSWVLGAWKDWMHTAKTSAQEMNVQSGKEVGYSICFENCTSAATRIQ